MKLLIISFDHRMLDSHSESFARMRDMASLTDTTKILVLGARGELSSENIRVLGIPGKKLIAAWKTIFQPGIFANTNDGIVMAQDPFLAGLVGLYIARRTSSKLLIGVYGNDVYDKYWRRNNSFGYLRSIVGRWVLHAADAIQTDGLESQKELAARFPGKVFWKPMVPADIEKFSPAREPHDTFRILYASRLTLQKNIPRLVDVVKKLSAEGGKIEITIAGDGPLSSQLQTLASSDIHILGAVTREHLENILPRQDVLILTSHFEGMPRIFMEAAAAGVPIVTTRVGGISGLIVDGESGFVILQGDVNTFCQKILELAANPSLRLRMSAAIRQNFDRQFPQGITLQCQKKVFDFLDGK